MTKKSFAPVVSAPPESDRDLLIFEEADEFLTGRSPAPMEDVQAKVKEAQEELLHLRQRQEEIERQQQLLELIRQKQERFANGKRELTERISRSVVAIEGELYNSQKLVEELTATYDTYNRHLDILRSLQPEKWQRNQVDEELDRALAAIEEAQSDFAKSTRRLDSLRPSSPDDHHASTSAVQSTGSLTLNDDLKVWAKRGFAFVAVPLLAATVVGLLIARLLF